MITEDYVSFEVAKLLKEKGFDEQCMFMYDSQHKLYSTFEQCMRVTRNNSDWVHVVGKLNICPIAVPTLQMTMKWLREMYGLMIVVHPSYPIDGIKYESLIYRLTELKDASVDEYNYDDKEYDNYEQACESAIKYCIENLI